MNETLRKAALVAQSLLNDFDPIWEEFTGELNGQALEPMFILGSPRSGTTLLYQLLTGQFQLCYVSNIMALCPKCMLRMCRRWPRVASYSDGAIKRDYFGFVSGLLSPSEAGKILDKWFVHDSTVLPERRIIATFAAIAIITKCPLVIKNLDNCHRLANLRAMFPSARFLHVQRDPLYTAQSILLGRQQVNGNMREWWSVRVPGYQRLINQNPVDQVVWQISRIEELLLGGLSDIPSRVSHIRYEDLCARPAEVLTDVAAKFRLEPRQGALRTIQPLTPSRSIRLEKHVWDHLVRAIESAFGPKSSPNLALHP